MSIGEIMATIRPAVHALHDTAMVIREAAGVPDTFHFQELRHIQTSLMLAHVPTKVIQKRFGHSDYSFTANVFAQRRQNAHAKTLSKLDSLMESRTPPVSNVRAMT
jgi:integrase